MPAFGAEADIRKCTPDISIVPKAIIDADRYPVYRLDSLLERKVMHTVVVFVGETRMGW